MPEPPVDMDSVRARVLDWFAHCKRPLPWRQDYLPYAVWIAEIMGQQTQLERVAYREKRTASVSYTVFFPSKKGSPAFGSTERKASVSRERRRRLGSISCGPTRQFIPNTSTSRSFNTAAKNLYRGPRQGGSRRIEGHLRDQRNMPTAAADTAGRIWKSTTTIRAKDEPAPPFPAAKRLWRP